MNYCHPELAERLAAEYVLGTLRGPARQRFKALLPAHPLLRHQVQIWETRLGPLAEVLPPVSPPPRLWTEVQRRLFPPIPWPRWYQRLALWRGLTLGGGLLAGALALLLWLAPLGDRQPAYVVMIAEQGSQRPLWLVSVPPAMDQLYIKNLKPMDMPLDQNCLLWLRPPNSQQVYPLGVLPDQGDGRLLKVDATLRAMLPGALLVTMEPRRAVLPAAPGAPPLYEGRWLPLKPF